MKSTIQITDPTGTEFMDSLIPKINEPNVFLQLEIDTISDAGTVLGRFINKTGKLLHEEVLAVDVLQKGD